MSTYNIIPRHKSYNTELEYYNQILKQLNETKDKKIKDERPTEDIIISITFIEQKIEKLKKLVVKETNYTTAGGKRKTKRTRTNKRKSKKKV